jgi:hypothetical protein
MSSPALIVEPDIEVEADAPLCCGTGGLDGRDDGPDRVYGSAGPDQISVKDGAYDYVECGAPATRRSPGAPLDEVLYDKGLDDVADDCEVKQTQ